MLPLHASRPIEQRRGSLALAIKRRTAEAHRRAEAAVLATGLFESHANYTRYLSRIHGFYAVLEPRLDAWIPLGARRKLPLLERDLAVLGHRPSAAPDVRVPRVTTRAAAFGVAYVLEGKTLGARFLLAEASARLGLGAETGAAFLAGYGAETAGMWTSFRAELEAFARKEGRRRAVVAGAEATFACFTAWIGETACATAGVTTRFPVLIRGVAQPG